jgi:hydrogenase maturation protease
MPDLREQIRKCFEGRVCLMGLGNVEYGDDGLGVHLARAIAEAGGRGPRSTVHGPQSTVRSLPFALRPPPSQVWCLVAGQNPERFLGRVAQRGFDNLVFLDAVEFGGLPGSVILLDCQRMAARFPQVSTHKVSLGLLAKWAEANGTTRAWLLGVQPASLEPGAPLSAQVQATLEVLMDLLSERLEEAPTC